MLFGVVLIKIDNSAGNYNRTFIEVRLLLHELTIAQNEHLNHIPEKNNLTSSNFGSNPSTEELNLHCRANLPIFRPAKKSFPHIMKSEPLL